MAVQQVQFATHTDAFENDVIGNSFCDGTEFHGQYVIGQACRVTSIGVIAITAPDPGNGWTFTVRKNGVQNSVIGNTSLSTTILSGTAGFAVGSVSFAVGDKLSVRVTKAPLNDWGGNRVTIVTLTIEL